MKNPQRDIMILLTCIFAVFLGGFMLGRNYNHSEIQLSSIQVSEKVVESPKTVVSNPGTSERININTASVSDLMCLPGIGTVTAEKIVAYRKENGRFTSVAQLTNVSGIGEKKLAEIIDLITVG